MMNAVEEKKRTEAREKMAFIDRFVADYCRPHEVVEAECLAAFIASRQMSFMQRPREDFALAAGSSAPDMTGVRAPNEEVTFTFASEGSVDAPGAWKASLTVPPNAGPETMLTLAVSESDGTLCTSGVFTLSGVALPLVEGCAEIPFGVFLAGIKDTKVSFQRSDECAVKGTLAFFC